MILRWLLSAPALLPLKVLYLLADLTYFIIYRIAGYRKATVRKNLRASFPTMTQSELRQTESAFYHHLADYFFETLKLAGISNAEMRRRMVFTNPEVIDSLLSQGRSVAVYFSHCFNWEWAPSVTLWSAYAGNPGVEFCQVYRPLKNRALDSWFGELRSRFGSRSLAKSTVARDLLRLHRQGKLTVTGFMSDQRVSHIDHSLRVDLLGQSTEAIAGTELLARRMNMAAVYWDMRRTCRGHYEITTRVLSENPAELEEGELTRRYISCLEATIRHQPSNWLWSHKRWKPVNHPHPTVN